MSAASSGRQAQTQAFRRRRALNWVTLGLTYAAMYMARYNFAFANKDLSDSFGFSKAQIGSIGACIFNFGFGLGAYFGFLSTGALLLFYFATIWTLNMYFQSYSALAVIKV